MFRYYSFGTGYMSPLCSLPFIERFIELHGREPDEFIIYEG